MSTWYHSCRSAVSGMQHEVDRYGRSYCTERVSGLSNRKLCEEIIGYSCTLSGWRDRDEVKQELGEKNYGFLQKEFKEWLDPSTGNPGLAWKEDPETWEPFLTEEGTFNYTYNYRFFLKDRNGYPAVSQFENLISLFKSDLNTRQAFVGVWSPHLDNPAVLKTGADARVPCTIGYQFFLRDLLPDGVGGKRLEMVYSMRSLCASWNLWNDLYLVTSLFDWFRDCLIESIGEPIQPVGGLIHMHVGSLHVFKEEEKGENNA